MRQQQYLLRLAVLLLSFCAAACLAGGATRINGDHSPAAESRVMSFQEIKDWGVPCEQPFVACELDKDCMACFDPFTPSFSLDSMESCDGLEDAFDRSCSAMCDTDNKHLRGVRACLSDEWFNIITLGAVTDFCSGNKTQIADATAAAAVTTDE
jgi:hypothetical protein